MKITLQNPTLDMLFELKDQEQISLNNLIYKIVRQYYNNNYKGFHHGHNNKGEAPPQVGSIPVRTSGTGVE